MFGKRITLFRIFGFAVRIDLSWLIIVVLVVWSLAGGVFPQRYEGLSTEVYYGMALLAALGFFASIVFHELCHSLVARRYGMSMKGITLFIFGGVAEMGDEPPSPGAEFWMAIAGPASSLLVAGVFLGAYLLAESAGAPTWVVGVLYWVGAINFILVIFNLLPGFPLDGGRVLRSIIWRVKGDLRKATYIASRVGAGFGAALIALGVLGILGVPYISSIAGLWHILIGLFLRYAARSGYQQVIIREMLKGEPLRRFMTARPVTVPPDLTIADLVEHYIYRYHFKMFPIVDADDTLRGCITTRDVREIPREEWSRRTVAEVAPACAAENTIAPDEDAVRALALMTRSKLSRLMVVDDGKLVGILSLKDLTEFLALKMELEDEKVHPPPLPPDAQR